MDIYPYPIDCFKQTKTPVVVGGYSVGVIDSVDYVKKQSKLNGSHLSGKEFRNAVSNVSLQLNKAFEETKGLQWGVLEEVQVPSALEMPVPSKSSEYLILEDPVTGKSTYRTTPFGFERDELPREVSDVMNNMIVATEVGDIVDNIVGDAVQQSESGMEIQRQALEVEKRKEYIGNYVQDRLRKMKGVGRGRLPNDVRDLRAKLNENFGVGMFLQMREMLKEEGSYNEEELNDISEEHVMGELAKYEDAMTRIRQRRSIDRAEPFIRRAAPEEPPKEEELPTLEPIKREEEKPQGAQVSMRQEEDL